VSKIAKRSATTPNIAANAKKMGAPMGKNRAKATRTEKIDLSAPNAIDVRPQPRTVACTPMQKLAGAGFEPETSHPQRIGKCCASQSVARVPVIN
jgi:hypothetical protein